MYEAWKASKFSKPWAYENFIQERSLRRAQVPPARPPPVLGRMWAAGACMRVRARLHARARRRTAAP